MRANWAEHISWTTSEFNMTEGHRAGEIVIMLRAEAEAMTYLSRTIHTADTASIQDRRGQKGGGGGAEQRQCRGWKQSLHKTSGEGAGMANITRAEADAIEDWGDREGKGDNT